MGRRKRTNLGRGNKLTLKQIVQILSHSHSSSRRARHRPAPPLTRARSRTSMASLRKDRALKDRALKRHIDLFGTPAAKRGGSAVKSALECETPGFVQAFQGSQWLPRPAQIGRGRPLLGLTLSGEPRPTRTETPASARGFAPRSPAKGSNFRPVVLSVAPPSPAPFRGL
jgi:hypothetical protein